MTRWGRYRALALIVLTAVVFANALGGAFLFDDRRDVIENPAAKAATFFEHLAKTNRPLTKASYAAQDAIHGPWSPGFHAVNVGLHLAATLLAFALIRRAARQTGQHERAGVVLSIVVSALWAVHPALSETVTYVSGRSMGLSALLMLAALFAASGPQTQGARIAAFGCAILAVLARETALILPAILLAWQVTLQPFEAWRSAAARLAPLLLGTVAGGGLILAMPHHRDLIANSLEIRSPLYALRGNLFAATEIYRFWFMPWQVTILPAPPVIHGWADPATLWRLALFGAAAAAALAWRRRAPLAAFGVLLALLALIPSNSILWRADPVGLKPLYLSGLGLTLALAGLADALLRSRIALAIAAGLVVTLGMMTMARNVLFADPVALFSDAAEKTPDETRPLVYLGSALMEAGRLDEAAAALDAALEIDPYDPAARNAARVVAAMRGVDARKPPP